MPRLLLFHYFQLSLIRAIEAAAITLSLSHYEPPAAIELADLAAAMSRQAADAFFRHSFQFTPFRLSPPHYDYAAIFAAARLTPPLILIRHYG